MHLAGVRLSDNTVLERADASRFCARGSPRHGHIVGSVKAFGISRERTIALARV